MGAGGVYHLTFTAHNGTGSDAVQHFTLNVDEAPTFTSASSGTFVAGMFGTFTITAVGTPVTTLSEAGELPTGVTFNSSTGVLSGTPAAGSLLTYEVTFTAQNILGASSVQTFILVIVDHALSSTPASQTVAAGSLATFAIANVTSLTYALTCTGLPAGASCGTLSVPPYLTAFLVITTTSRNAGVPLSPNRMRFRIQMWLNVSIVLVLSLATILAARAGRRFAMFSFGALALLLVFTTAGCGVVGGSGGTSAGTYTITVTGTAQGAATQSVNLTLIVTQPRFRES